MRNQNGITSIGYLLLTSLLLVICPFVLFSFLLIKNYSLYQNECRIMNLEIQKILASSMNTLEEMNSVSEKLRQEEDAINALLKIAKDPFTIAALTTKLNLNRAQQFQHRLHQEQIILRAHGNSMQTFYKFKKNKFFILNKTPKLHIYKTPIHRIAQNVKTLPNFEHLQKLQIQWRSTELPILSNWKVQALSSACAASIQQKGNRWFAQLKKAQ